MIRYTEDMTAVTEGMLTGFFVGWPKAPSVQLSTWYDEPLLPYYAKLGMTAVRGAGLGNGPALQGPVA